MCKYRFLAYECGIVRSKTSWPFQISEGSDFTQTIKKYDYKNDIYDVVL